MANPFLHAIRLVRDAAMKHSFRVALIGGFALPFHGVRRATGDVDFLVDASGADALHDVLVGAGYEPLHRSADVANYRATRVAGAGVDVLYAHRAPTVAMLERAVIPAGSTDIPVVDVEGLIGLKPSPDSLPKRASRTTEPLAAGGPSQGDLRPETAVRSLEEFIAFLEAIEEVVGRDEGPRGPTVGARFLL